MFDRLEDFHDNVLVIIRVFRKLMKEQSDLTPIVEAYKEYKQCKQNIEDSLAMLDEETDEEMKELAKEELNDSKARVEELEQKQKFFFFQKTRMMTRTLFIPPIPISSHSIVSTFQRLLSA